MTNGWHRCLRRQVPRARYIRKNGCTPRVHIARGHIPAGKGHGNGTNTRSLVKRRQHMSAEQQKALHRPTRVPRTEGTGIVTITQDRDFNSISITVGIARTTEDHERGLAGRRTLGESEGMLFLFDHEDYYPFWMKDTYIPLDLVFADADGTIVTVCRDLRPDHTTLYYPSKPSCFVLEVCSGFLERHGIREGDRMAWTVQP
jgi:uncharacterized protein